MATTAVVAEVDSVVVKEAAEVLADIGLTTSDLLGLALKKVARDKSLPDDLLRPNAETLAAIEVGDRGEVTRYGSVDELFAELGVNAK